MFFAEIGVMMSTAQSADVLDDLIFSKIDDDEFCRQRINKERPAPIYPYDDKRTKYVHVRKDMNGTFTRRNISDLMIQRNYTHEYLEGTQIERLGCSMLVEFQETHDNLYMT